MIMDGHIKKLGLCFFSEKYADSNMSIWLFCYLTNRPVFLTCCSLALRINVDHHPKVGTCGGQRREITYGVCQII